MEVYSEILGTRVRIPDAPSRIVSLAPSITETLYELGAEDRVVGISHFCHKPSRVAGKPRVGSYLSVNYAELERLEPDLILTVSGAQLGVSRELHEKGFPVYPLPLPTTVYGILDLVVNVGRLVGLQDEAERLASELAGRLASIKPLDPPVSGYYEIDLGGPVTVGRFSYINNSLRLLGVVNVFSDDPRPYLEPSPDRLRNADVKVVIYEASPHKPVNKNRVQAMMEERGLGGSEALREGRIVILEPDSLAHHGPSHVEVLERLASALRSVFSR